MMNLRKQYHQLTLLLICLLLSISCKPLSPLFDQHAYTQAIDLKVESVFLMRKATEPFEKHRDAVENLKKAIEKAYEYEKGRGLDINEETIAMWEKIKAEDAGLLGEFLKRWEQDSVRSSGIISLKIPQIEEAYDIIIGLESKRRREAVELKKIK